MCVCVYVFVCICVLSVCVKPKIVFGVTDHVDVVVRIPRILVKSHHSMMYGAMWLLQYPQKSDTPLHTVHMCVHMLGHVARMPDAR